MTPRIQNRSICVGLEISQRHQPGAICVTEMQDRGGLGGHHRHWIVRFLESMPPGTRLPEVTRRLAEIMNTCAKQHGETPQVLVNSTGIGKLVVEQLESEIGDGRFYTVYFNQGDRRIVEGNYFDDTVTVGKAYLVSALQTALQTERLHLPRQAEYDRLAEELLGFQVDLPPDANERYGSFRVGSRDELVNALGLTVQHDPGLATGIGGAGDDDHFINLAYRG